MVKVVDYKARTSEEGNTFYALILQSGVEIVQSRNGNQYITAKRVSLPSSFDEQTCQDLIGTELSGTIEKVPCEPYEYTLDTGEVITRTERYQYVAENTPVPAHGALHGFTTMATPSTNGHLKPTI